MGADCITAKALSGNMRLNTEQESFVDMAEQIFEVPVKVHAWKKTSAVNKVDKLCFE